MAVSFLDQSPVFVGESDSDAIRNSLRIVQQLDQVVKRCWFSENHFTPFFASAAPDILLGQAAAITSTIQLGAGGILLRNHPPLQVAERFATLEALHPDRINLGVGVSSVGHFGDPDNILSSVEATEAFKRVDMLDALRTNKNPEVYVAPYIAKLPSIWLLGKSPYVAQYAAERGLPYLHASFINMDNEVEALTTYKKAFKPVAERAPYLVWVIFSVIADSDQEAMYKTAPYRKWYADTYHRHQCKPFPTIETALQETYSAEEIAGLNQLGRLRFVGKPDSVVERIAEMKQRYHVDEVMVLSITESVEDRIATVKQIAQIL